MLFWLLLCYGFLVGDFFPSQVSSSLPVPKELALTHNYQALTSPILAEEVSAEEQLEESQKQLEASEKQLGELRFWFFILCFPLAGGCVWLLIRAVNKYQLTEIDLEDVPTGQFAVEVKRMGDRRIRTSDGLLAGIHAIALVHINDKKPDKELAQNCLADSEGEITQESVTTVVTSHLEGAIASIARTTTLSNILNNKPFEYTHYKHQDSDKEQAVEEKLTLTLTQHVKEKIETPLSSLGLTLLGVELVDIEGKSPFGQEYAVSVNIEGVKTQDNLQANLNTIFFVRVASKNQNGKNRSVSSILIENGQVTQKRVEMAVRQRAIPAIRAAANDFTLKDINYSQYFKHRNGGGLNQNLGSTNKEKIETEITDCQNQLKQAPNEYIKNALQRQIQDLEAQLNSIESGEPLQSTNLTFSEKIYQYTNVSGIGLETVGIVISEIDGADIYGTEYAIEVELAGPNALRMKDFMRADIQTTFLVTLNTDDKDTDDKNTDDKDNNIDKAYRALSEGEAISPERIREAIHKRAINALQVVGLKRTLKDIHDNRAKFAEAVKMFIEERTIPTDNTSTATTSDGNSQNNSNGKQGTIKDLGLTLKEVIITEIEESDYYLDNTNDYFDIQGIAKRTDLIGANQVKKLKKELQTERLLEVSEKTHQEKSLEILKAKEQLTIEGEMAVESHRLRQEIELKKLQTFAQVIMDQFEVSAATKMIVNEINRLTFEAQRVTAEEGVNTAIEEAKKLRGETLQEIAQQEANRIKLLANADAESKKTISDLDRLAMIVTTLMPQLMEHLPEITEVAKAMSLQPGALTNAHIYGNGKGLNNMMLPGGLANVVTTLIDKLDLNKSPNGNGNGSHPPQQETASDSQNNDHQESETQDENL